MQDSIVQLGVGATVAYLLLKEIFVFLKPVLTKKSVSTEQEILVLVEKIHEMHNLKDEDGVYVWYVKASLAKSITRLSDSIDRLVVLLRENNE